MGAMEATDSWRIVKLVSLAETRCRAQKSIRGYLALLPLTRVMSKRYASCVVQDFGICHEQARQDLGCNLRKDAIGKQAFLKDIKIYRNKDSGPCLPSILLWE